MHVSLANYRGLLGTYLRPQAWRVGLLAALLLSGIALQLVNPQIVRYFLDTASTGGPEEVLVLAALGFLAAGLGQRALAFATVYVGETVGWVATNALRADLARHCLRLDMSFHKRRTPGELIERVDGDVTALGNFFSQFSIKLLANAVLLVAILALLFREDWRIGVGMTIYAVVGFGVLGAAQNVGLGRWAAYRQAEAEQFGFLEERMSGVEDIRSAGAEAHTLSRLDAIVRDVLRKNRAARLVSTMTFVGTNALFVFGYALGLGLGAYLYSAGSVSIGTAFLLVYYVGMLAQPLETIREQAQDLQQAGASIARVQDLLAVQPRVREAPRAALPAAALPVAFEGVSFAYRDEEGPGRDDGPPTTGHQPPNIGDSTSPDRTDEQSSSSVQRPASVVPSPDLVLSDVSFTIAPGEVLGLLGRTGSGKTTLTRLLFRLYDPSAGAVRLGGVNLRDVAFADLRARVGMVTQDVQIFQASIRENLALFDRGVDDRLIERALDELQLLDWVRSLPGGLDTRLGAGGLGLSAGEAQLLAFARVFLRDPGLIILDEASSRLDPATERLLERAIDRLLHGRTAIVIAHRLSTVRRADQILILDRGRVAELGPRRALAADPDSRFARLLQAGLEEVLV